MQINSYAIFIKRRELKQKDIVITATANLHFKELQIRLKGNTQLN